VVSSTMMPKHSFSGSMKKVSSTVSSNMNSLIVLFCVASAAQAAYLPYFHHAAVVPSVAKSTITYKTAAYEPVDAATPAHTKKIELVEKEHSHDVYTPTYTYAAAHPAVLPGVATYAAHPGFVGYPFGVLPVVAPKAEAEAEAEAPAVEEA